MPFYAWDETFTRSARIDPLLGQLQPGGVWRITDVPWPASRRQEDLLRQYRLDQMTAAWVMAGASVIRTSEAFRVGPWA